MVSAAEQHLPFLSETVEQWHALRLPFAHRGAVNWRGTVQDGFAIRTTPEKPEGPLVVITSAGFNSLDRDQYPRFARLNRGVQDVIKFYSQGEGNLRRDVFVGEFDRRDSFTVSLWRDDKAVLQGAYRGGTHRAPMDRSRDGSFFDRSSFTRTRLISSTGSWSGDPLSEKAGSLSFADQPVPSQSAHSHTGTPFACTAQAAISAQRCKYKRRQSAIGRLRKPPLQARCQRDATAQACALS